MNPKDDTKKARQYREDAQANRDGFVRLHESQKEVFSTQADRLDNFETSATVTINSIARLRIYVSLTDLNLGPFVGNAKLKARTAYLTGTRNWHHHYTIDVADVDIKLTGRSVYIRITPADKFYFEFATSGKPVVVETVEQDGVTFPNYKGCIVGVNVQLEKGKLITRAQINKQKRASHGSEVSLIRREWQVQLHDEPVCYPNAKTKFGRVRATNALFESFAPKHPWTGVPYRSTDAILSTFAVTTQCGPNQTYGVRDTNFDVPYQDNDKADPVRLAYIRGDADWPRANGKQRVESEEFGAREFAVYVDAFNQFNVFPVAAIEALNVVNPYLQNVLELCVQRLTPALPAWAYQPSMRAVDYWAANPNTDEWIIDEPDTDWKFNHTGTKAVAILFEREAYSYDTSFWSTDSNASCPFNGTKFATLSSWMGVTTNYVMTFGPRTYNPTRYFTAPGVVEVEVRIRITGAELHQYTAELVVKTIRQPSVPSLPATPTTAAPPSLESSRWALFVGYVWHDVPKRTNTNMQVKAGTLVSLDMEYWMHPGGTYGDATDRQFILSCRDLRTGDELFSAVGAPILAIDLTTLSMVLRLDAYTVDRRYVGGGASALNFPIHHFGAWVIHSGVGKEVLFPENTPAEAKTLLESYAALNGRAYLANKITTAGGGWEYVPVTTTNDGWSVSAFSNFRNWWAFQNWYSVDHFWALIDTDIGFYGDHVRYKTSGSPPGYPSDGNTTKTWLNAMGSDWPWLFFCDSPRWGWHQYVSAMALNLAVDINTTFFTHPNGSYAFWCDGWLYDRNGLPGDFVLGTGAGGSSGTGQGSGSDFEHDTLAIYDAKLVEHVIFDRVHFEVRAKDQPSFTNNTSFMELYNKAVKNGKAAGTLVDAENLQELELVDMRATFAREIGNDTGLEHEFLDLKMTLPGVDSNWWYRESAWSRPYAATPLPPLVGTCGNFNNINIYAYWRVTNYAGGGTARSAGHPEPDAYNRWRIHFANPIIIMKE